MPAWPKWTPRKSFEARILRRRKPGVGADGQSSGSTVWRRLEKRLSSVHPSSFGMRPLLG